MSQSPPSAPRREFILKLAGACWSAWTLQQLLAIEVFGALRSDHSQVLSDGALNLSRTVWPRGRYGRVLADLHVHPMLNDWNRQSPMSAGTEGLYDLVQSKMNPTFVDWKQCHDIGVDMLCVAHFNPFDEFASMPTDLNPDAPRNALRMFDQLEAELETKYSAYAKIVRCGKDLETLTTPHVESEKRRIAVVHTLEGGHALGGKLEALDEFAQRGVAMITVTHFFYKGIGTSANSIPFFPDAGAADPTVGLSSYGRDVVAKMEELKMIVDIAHATAPTIADILKTAKRPLIASHTAARTLGNHPYSIVDEHIQEVARRGGVIGVILMPYWLSNYSNVHEAENKGTLREVVRTVQYIYKITGKHTCIGIGSDFGGFITGPKGMTALSKIDELRGLLLQEFNPDQVEDIMANNVIDFFKENWGRDKRDCP